MFPFVGNVIAKVHFRIQSLGECVLEHGLKLSVNNVVHFHYLCLDATRQNLSSGFSKRPCPSQPAQLQRLPRKFASSSLDMILFNKRITDCAVARAGLRLCCSQVPKAGFLASRSIYIVS